MPSQNRSVKPRSLAAWPAVLTVVAGIATVSPIAGCIVVAHDDGGMAYVHDDTGGGSGTTLDTPMQVAIDTGATLGTDPGQGVGIFVEYAGEGHWHVWTSCDSSVSTSGIACHWDAFVTAVDGSPITNIAGERTEGEDFVDRDPSDGAAHLYAVTSTDFDGFTFDATPGTTVRLEVYLDGNPEPHFVYWTSDDVAHTGAPTDPVDFVPNKP